MNYELSIAIQAPLEQVWTVLSDVERWPEWTASVTRVTYVAGKRLAVGSRVRIKQPGLPALLWEVTEVTPLQSFTWQSRSRGIVTRASHYLSPGSAGGVTVRLGLQQSGPLAGLIGLLTGRRTRNYVRAEGLKRRCEATAAGGEGS